MFFFLSKTLSFLLMPMGWLTLSLLGYLFLKNTVWKKRCGRIFLGLLIVFTNPFLSNELVRWWELSPVEFDELNEGKYLAIVLTGVSDNVRQPADRVYFSKGADRVTHAVQLYKMGKVDKILIGGGSGAFVEPELSESENLKRAFMMMGVPAKDLMVETRSKNTHQTAQNIKSEFRIIRGRKILLITSSFHMKRAVGCFQKVGIEVTPFPVDFYYSRRKFTPDAWIPSPGALQKWTVVLHEIVGIGAYKLMGYL